jgi:hypothetical protein
MYLRSFALHAKEHIFKCNSRWLQLEASKVAGSNLSGDIVEKFFGLKTVHFEGILTF